MLANISVNFSIKSTEAFMCLFWVFSIFYLVGQLKTDRKYRKSASTRIRICYFVWCIEGCCVSNPAPESTEM